MRKDYALMKNAKGEFLLGIGPFEELEECPREGVAFYVNDFSLSRSRPWKRATKVERMHSFPGGKIGGKAAWKAPELKEFSDVFKEVSDAILKGEIDKSVPVVSEHGSLLEGDPNQLIFSCEPGSELHPYAWSEGDQGFCGLTPEVLFTYEKGRIETMALAGTASVEERDVFAVDQKEIKEHEFVAQTLITKLNRIGMVRPETRRIMELKSLVHFYTPIHVGLYDVVPMEKLICDLHPTPALGPLPKDSISIQQLEDWRRRLECPDFFGAPMGVYDNGVFHVVVCIRGFLWEQNKLTLPAGCGVIGDSRLINEWRELTLKRESVKKLFKF